MFPSPVTIAQTVITPGGVIIQQPDNQNDSVAQQLAICINSLNGVQNESEGSVTLYGSLRPWAIDYPYRFAKPSNVPDDEMNRVGLRNRDGDDVWVGNFSSVIVRTTNASNLSNREIMELCLQRTPQFNSSPSSVTQPPYYSPQPQPTVIQPSYYTPQPQPQPPNLTPQPASSTILMVGNPNQPVPVDIAAQISASLAGRGLSAVACNLNPGVTILVGQYMACAYPTPSYPAGQYTLR